MWLIHIHGFQTVPSCGFSEDGKTRNFRPLNSVLFLFSANITASLSYKNKIIYLKLKDHFIKQDQDHQDQNHL